MRDRRSAHLRLADWRRRRRLSVAWTALPIAIVMAGVATSADAATKLALTTQPNVPFPVRVYALSLPGAGAPSTVRVTENGRRVKASLTPIGRKRIPFSAVLLLDSSLTMIGGPLVAARAAAAALIANKPVRSELALTGFSAQPYAVHDFSKSRASLTSSLTKLKTRYGTAVWNSVILASRQLRVRKGSAKAIVILTDGRADTTTTDVGRAIRAAKGSGARVFVVVAGSGGSKQRTRLNRLADTTGGSVLQVSSIPQLRRAFTQLARTLSRQYLLSYASQVKEPGRIVRVSVRIDNANAAMSYTTPPGPAPASKPSFWLSAKGGAILVLGFILVPVVALIAFGLLRGRRQRGYY